METPRPEKLQEVPDIDPTTGISKSFLEDCLWIPVTYRTRQFPELVQMIRRSNWRMRTYEERFPADKYANVVNEKNRDAIAQINKLAAVLNEAIEDGTLGTVINEKDFKNIYNTISTLCSPAAPLL